eukprot:5060764-Prymnesium_polylepis.1
MAARSSLRPMSDCLAGDSPATMRWENDAPTRRRTAVCASFPVLLPPLTSGAMWPLRQPALQTRGPISHSRHRQSHMRSLTVGVAAAAR